MFRLARFSLRRPRAALTAWLVVAIALSLIGLGVSDSVSPSITVVPGTQSSRAEHLADTNFGPSILAPVMLEGEKRVLDARGPVVVAALTRRLNTRVLSAWDKGQAGAALRPSKTAAMIVAAVAATPEEMVATEQAEIEEAVQRAAGPELQTRFVGNAVIDRALKDEMITQTRRAELIALPILFVLLLVLLRAPLAAGLLTLVSAGTAMSGFGVMALMGEVIDVDATAIALASMTGLALGVGYGLMVFRRYQDELHPEGTTQVTAAEAASRAVQSSGRAVLVGATALSMGLVLATLIAPTTILTSLGVGVLVCSLIGVGAAVVVMPAAIALFGRGLDAFPRRPGLAHPLGSAWARLVAAGGWVTRHALGAGFVATLVLAALAIPVFGLQTGPPGPSMLPADNQARTDFERVAAVMGAGWPTPYNMVVVTDTGAITDHAMLEDLDAFQARLAKDPAVESVLGPGEFHAPANELVTLPGQLADSADMIKGGKKKLGELASGLGEAGAGAQKLQEGLGSAAAGAGELQSGSGKIGAGAGTLEENLEKARAGAAQISGGLGQALDAANQLRDGSAALLKGSKQISGGLGQVAPQVTAGLPAIQDMAANVNKGSEAVSAAAVAAGDTSAQLEGALAQLSALPASPERDAAIAAVKGAQDSASSLSGNLAAAQPGLGSAAAVSTAFGDTVSKLSVALAQLNAGSSELSQGIAQLQDGNSQLAAGIAKLSGGGGDLATGLVALRDGAATLQAYLGQLTAGAGTLSSGLSAGTGPAGELAAGLVAGGSEVAKFRGALPSPESIERLQASSPGLFDSSYFVLAAVEGAPEDSRDQASFLVNLESGGDAGQITIVSKYGMESDANHALGMRLRDEADRFAKATGTEVVVGGPAGELSDFEDETLSRFWPTVIVLTAAVALLLMVALRSVLIPLVAVAFDLLTAGATFGVMALAFSGDDPLMGGPGYIDPMSLIGIFAMVFGLTMVYEVLLLGRTRERFVRTGDADGAIRHGLRRTAPAATGAALVMIAAVIPFLATDLLAVRQFGLGMAVAVLLDAFVVRPVLLPAAVEILGARGWWPTKPTVPPAPKAPAVPAAPAGGRFARPVSGPGPGGAAPVPR